MHRKLRLLVVSVVLFASHASFAASPGEEPAPASPPASGTDPLFPHAGHFAGMRHPDVYWELVGASEGLVDPDASLAMVDRAVAAPPEDTMLLDLQRDWREHRERRLAATAK